MSSKEITEPPDQNLENIRDLLLESKEDSKLVERTLAVIDGLLIEQAAMRAVLRAVIATHHNPKALLEESAWHLEFVGERVSTRNLKGFEESANRWLAQIEEAGEEPPELH